MHLWLVKSAKRIEKVEIRGELYDLIKIKINFLIKKLFFIYDDL